MIERIATAPTAPTVRVNSSRTICASERPSRRIDASDPAFASLLVWADRDGDRRSTPDELSPLSDVVTAIPLASRLDPRCDDAGNCEGERGAALVRDGSSAAVVDVYLPER